MNASGRNLSGPLSRLAIGFILYFWVYISEVIYRYIACGEEGISGGTCGL
jgi:hypothetical protein